MFNFEVDPELLQEQNNLMVVPVGISNHHVHLSKEHLAILFGEGAELHPMKPLSQPGQYAADECVNVVGLKSSLEKVRVLGPVRKQSQVELSQTDARKLGLQVEVRDSGNLAGTCGAVLVGPKGYVVLQEGVIIAKTHLHLSTAEGAERGIKDKDQIDIYLKGQGKSGCIFDVLARVGDAYALDLHIDTDEANTFRVDNNAKALILPKAK